MVSRALRSALGADLAIGSRLTREQRIDLIARKLIRSGASIVCLQELWMPADKRHIENSVRRLLVCVFAGCCLCCVASVTWVL
jgi:hypothetical protein